jgi:hypothetical protein
MGNLDLIGRFYLGSSFGLGPKTLPYLQNWFGLGLGLGANRYGPCGVA